MKEKNSRNKNTQTRNFVSVYKRCEIVVIRRVYFILKTLFFDIFYIWCFWLDFFRCVLWHFEYIISNIHKKIWFFVILLDIFFKCLLFLSERQCKSIDMYIRYIFWFELNIFLSPNVSWRLLWAFILTYRLISLCYWPEFQTVFHNFKRITLKLLLLSLIKRFCVEVYELNHQN